MGLVCFGLNLVAYQFALQRLPISMAYPIMVTGGYAIIVVVAGLMGERMVPAQWVGVALILLGVGLVSGYMKPQQQATGRLEKAAAAIQLAPNQRHESGPVYGTLAGEPHGGEEFGGINIIIGPRRTCKVRRSIYKYQMSVAQSIDVRV